MPSKSVGRHFPSRLATSLCSLTREKGNIQQIKTQQQEGLKDRPTQESRTCNDKLFCDRSSREREIERPSHCLRSFPSLAYLSCVQVPISISATKQRENHRQSSDKQAIQKETQDIRSILFTSTLYSHCYSGTKHSCPVIQQRLSLSLSLSHVRERGSTEQDGRRDGDKESIMSRS